MNDILLPMEVWVARKGYDEEKVKAIRQLLLNHHAHQSVEGTTSPQPRTEVKGPNGEVLIDFVYHKDTQKFAELRAWSREVRGYLFGDEDSASPSSLSAKKQSDISGMKFPIKFEDIVSLIHHYDFIHEKSDGKKARLALVLAGGGAKCAYEAGAVTQLEKELKEQNSPPSNQQQNRTGALDFDLVVGTSGGALNALPVAAGASSASAGSERPLYSTWRDLNAVDILRPPLLVQFVLGVCYTFFYFILIRGVVLLCGGKKHPITSVRSVAILLIIVPFLFFTLFLFPVLLGPVLLVPSKLLFYLVLGLGCGVFFWAPISGLCGLAIWVHEKRRWPAAPPSDKRGHTSFFAEMLTWADPRHKVPISRFLAFGTILVGLAFILASRTKEGLFRGPSLANTVTERYTDLFARFTDRSTRALRSENVTKRREIISDAVYKQIRGGHRDLVVTASSLSPKSHGTKYFYIQAQQKRNPCNPRMCEPPGYGTYGIEIGKDCDESNLVDIALGSGTIFPIFPSHSVEVLQKSKRPTESMILIDGGFAHNTPIEAAVRWGATHIILIEVSPETSLKGNTSATFIDNALTAFNYLYDQAQLADVNAQEEAAVFVLRPRTRRNGLSVGLFDFGSRFAEYELNWGASDAVKRRFVRQPAAPHFWPLQAVK